MTTNLKIDANSPEDFESLKDEEKEVLLKWIQDNLNHIITVNKRHNSYYLKHIFERDKLNGGFYITNGQFKGAMLRMEFRPEKYHESNWYFRVSEKSIKKLVNRIGLIF